MTHTHTYAILKVSPETYNEIRGRLAAAGYADQFHSNADGELIDMHGIALREGEVLLKVSPTVQDRLAEGNVDVGGGRPVEIDREAFLRP